MPEAVKVNGFIYDIGPVNPKDPGPSWAPADLLAAFNVAKGHLSMAKRLLELTKGMNPNDHNRLLADERVDKQDQPQFADLESALPLVWDHLGIGCLHVRAF
jgi:hypothetical protein